MPFCQHCGNQVPESARFCSSCGRSISGDTSPNPEAPDGIERTAVTTGLASLAGRGRILRTGLALAGIVAFIAAVSTLFEAGLLARLRDGRATFAEAEANDTRQAALIIIATVVVLAAGVVWLFWQHRAQKNLQLLGARTKYSPGWAVGWWFVPVANIWMPYQTMRELYATSLPNPDGSRASNTPVIGWWWVAYLIGSFLPAVQGGVSEFPSYGELVVTSWIGVIGRLVQAGAALLAMRIVSDVVRGQHALAEQFADMTA